MQRTFYIEVHFIMASSRDRYLKRQKFCLVLSVFLLIFGLLQLGLGIFFALKSRDHKCHKVKYLLIGVYLVIAGISGIANYCPRRGQGHCKAKKAVRSRGFTTVFITFCALVTVVVILDNGALNCVSSNDSKHKSTRVYAILGLVEITGIHLVHLLSTLCACLALPDLWSPKTGWSQMPVKLLNSGSKNKCPKALHLPEARTHVQEATGTGDKVTVVSLPETDGIIYAVPEHQYVIRRDEATYVAPPGNTNLTAFFPTYRNSEGMI